MTRVWLLLLGVVLMSAESPIIRVSSRDSYEFAAVFGLCFMAANLILCARFGWRGFVRHFCASPKALAIAGVMSGVSNLCFFAAVKHSGVSLPVLVLAATPVTCALMSRVWLGERASVSVLVASVFVFLGIFIITGDVSGEASMAGIVYSVLCLICYSTLFVVWSSYEGVSAQATAVIGGSVVAGAGWLVAGFGLSGVSFWLAVFMGLVLTPAARILIRAGSLGQSAAFVGLVVILESVFAPLFAWIFLGEVPSARTLLGGAVILLAVVASTIFRSR